jgi:hypothetical protein
VTLKSGESFAGVLWSNDSRALVIRKRVGAWRWRETAPIFSLDGEVIVLMADVAYLQTPPENERR